MTPILLLSFIFSLVTLLAAADDINHDVGNSSEKRITQRNAGVNYTEILTFWQKLKNELIVQPKHKKVVLLMGNTGVGKSTLASALTGRYLESTTIEDQTYPVFNDSEKQVEKDSVSKTFISETMINSSNNVTYIDLPGIRDNLDVEQEISAIYFQNMLMNLVDKVKIVLVIDYDSLTFRGNKNDFDDLFNLVGVFMKNISKFHDGIGLVVMKVENIYDERNINDGLPVLINDNQSVLDGIVNYLKLKSESYRNMSVNIKKYRKLADLIDVLVQMENNLYPRIAIVRQPIQNGDSEKFTIAKNEINTITNMISTNLHYIRKGKYDFRPALSASLKLTIDQIINDIYRNDLMDRLYKLGDETFKHYLQLQEQYQDIDELVKQISNAYQVLLKLRNIDKPLELFEGFLAAANTLKISVSLSNVNEFYRDIKKLQFFTTLSNTNGNLYILLLKNEMQNIIQSTRNLMNIYVFLNSLSENLGKYRSQQLHDDVIVRIKTIKSSCAGTDSKSVESIVGLEEVVNIIGSTEEYQEIKKLQFNQFQLQHMKIIFDYFSRETQFLCTPEQLTVKGYNVKMRDVINNDCWSQARVINILAINKVFIDCSIDKTGASAQIFILAPTWEVLGGPEIILDGVAGKAYNETFARSAANASEDGENGRPGLPGGSAGHFFGVGKKFINSEYLVIHANGGEGGPGQHGGNGINGIVNQPKLSTNECFSDYFVNNCEDAYYSDGQKNNLEDVTTLRFIRKPPQGLPTNGGNGGVGGLGGYAGTVTITSLGSPVTVSISTNTGSAGYNGHGGIAGEITPFPYDITVLYDRKWETKIGL